VKESSAETLRNDFTENREGEVTSQEEVLTNLKKLVEDKNFLKKLTLITLKYIQYFFNKNDIDGQTAQDVLQTILEKFLNGKRKWYKKDGRTLENQIIMALISYVRNEFNKRYEIKEKNNDNEIEEVSDEPGMNDNEKKESKYKRKVNIQSIYDDEGNLRNYLLNDNDTADEEYDELEEKLLLNETFENINKAKELLAKEDEIGYFVFEKILECGKDNKCIADELGISIKEVENAKKRIRRKTWQIFHNNKKY